jgi:hypothetical protein
VPKNPTKLNEVELRRIGQHEHFGLKNRCSTPKLTRLAGACALNSYQHRSHATNRYGREGTVVYPADRGEDCGGMDYRAASALHDQVTELTFSSTSISQAAACSTASRCASLSLRKVSLSRRSARR